MTNEELQKAIELAEESVEGFADDDSFEMTLAKAVLELQDRLNNEREACAIIVDETIDFWVKAGYPECAEVRESMNIVESIRNRGQE
jgi:hypothetical protein